MKKRMAAVAVALALAGAWAAPLPHHNVFELKVQGRGGFDLAVSGGQKGVTYGFSINYPAGGPMRGGIQQDEEFYMAYATRVHHVKAKEWDKLPPSRPISNSVVTVACRAAGIDVPYFLWPHLHSGYGVYSHKEVMAHMSRWREIFPLANDRQYTFLFVPEPEKKRTLVYLDGSLCGRLEGVTQVTDVARTFSAGKMGEPLRVVSARTLSQRCAPGRYELPSLPFRCHPLLKAGATLSVKPGEQVIDGVPITVWAPESSIDQGQHRKTTPNRDLVWDPILTRTPWSVGTEYMQWSVPGRAWRYAWILCADIPQDGRESVLGTQFAKFGSGCTNGNIDFTKTKIDPVDAKTNGNVRAVGSLTYLDASGKKKLKTPLYLVRQPLDIAKLGARGTGKLALDFDLVGGGTWEGFRRSSVQVFGCTLEESPYEFRIKNPVRGNIFEKDIDEQVAGLDLIGNYDGAEGALRIEIFDPYFNSLYDKTAPFELGKAGVPKHVKLPLTRYGVGWYGMELSFLDAGGRLIMKHEASFTVLAPDDREAGYESPYACWPLTNGYHGSNPNRREQLDVMRKAGYRKTWNPPCDSEEEGVNWKVTRSSVGLGHLNPGAPAKTRAAFDARLDAAVADYRGIFEKFPHCEVIQLLHEQGGRDICPEVMIGVTPERGSYRDWDFDTPEIADSDRGDWEVFFCTEYARRMRKEFPGKRIMIGNGSSSSEKIASLIRRGFDLDLVDQLGIESKGFSTMPELGAHREAPGMLWALRETGRVFGYTNFTLNACNEYVFRPERKVPRSWSRREIMKVTDYTLRDYLISLAWGCDIISTGHLEDCNDAYYDTNWGAGGQCKFYPYSYPKRMFTGLAVLTRALDCPRFMRRVPNGEISSYVLEFQRIRRTPDWAYACWTPCYSAKVAMKFPKSATVRVIRWDGREGKLKLDDRSCVHIPIGSTPCYVISSEQITGCKVEAHMAEQPPKNAVVIARTTAGNTQDPALPHFFDPNPCGIPFPPLARFKRRTVKDPELKTDVLEVELVPDGDMPLLRWEAGNAQFEKPPKFKLSEVEGIGVWVKGNGSFGKIRLSLKMAERHTGYPWDVAPGGGHGTVCFDGWQFMYARLEGRPKNFETSRCNEVMLDAILFGTARKALDPIAMADVTNHLRIGPVVIVPKGSSKDHGDTQCRQAEAVMKTVDDKDL